MAIKWVHFPTLKDSFGLLHFMWFICCLCDCGAAVFPCFQCRKNTWFRKVRYSWKVKAVGFKAYSLVWTRFFLFPSMCELWIWFIAITFMRIKKCGKKVIFLHLTYLCLLVSLSIHLSVCHPSCLLSADFSCLVSPGSLHISSVSPVWRNFKF